MAAKKERDHGQRVLTDLPNGKYLSKLNGTEIGAVTTPKPGDIVYGTVAINGTEATLDGVHPTRRVVTGTFQVSPIGEMNLLQESKPKKLPPNWDSGGHKSKRPATS